MPWAGQGYERKSAPTDSGPIWLGVLPRCWTVIEVWRRCKQDVAIGMGGVLFKGITAAEVRSAVALLRRPRCEWPWLVEGVQLMGDIVAVIKNEDADAAAKQAAEEAKRKGGYAPRSTKRTR